MLHPLTNTTERSESLIMNVFLRGGRSLSGHVVALWCNNQGVPGETPTLRTNGSTGKEPGLFGAFLT